MSLIIAIFILMIWDINFDEKKEFEKKLIEFCVCMFNCYFYSKDETLTYKNWAICVYFNWYCYSKDLILILGLIVTFCISRFVI